MIKTTKVNVQFGMKNQENRQLMLIILCCYSYQAGQYSSVPGKVVESFLHQAQLWSATFVMRILGKFFLQIYLCKVMREV